MTRHDQLGPGPGAPLTAGPRWYRTRIRVFGPFLDLLPMALFGAASMIALQVGDGRNSGLLGLTAGVSAAPGLLAVGAPFAGDDMYPAAIAGSAVLWLALGWLASRRATGRAMASWRDYWLELFWLAIAVVIGSVIALGVAASVLGESLLF